MQIIQKYEWPENIDYVIRCTLKYRLPETTRLADQLT